MASPEQQLTQLHDMMEALNKGNASNDDVAAVFAVIMKVLGELRETLENKIASVDHSRNESHRETFKLLGKLEARVANELTRHKSGYERSVKDLQTTLRADVHAIRKLIPQLPDFQAMLAEVEAKIPTIPEIPKPIEYTAGRNISIEDGEITNTNPTITVSKEKPTYPQRGDVWIRPKSWYSF